MKILMLEKCARNEQQRWGVSKVISILDLRGGGLATVPEIKKHPKVLFSVNYESCNLELVSYAEVVTNA